MTKIVKACAVVDDRQQFALTSEQRPILATGATPILKRQTLLHGMPLAQARPQTQDSYLEELNRIRIEIEAAKAELRSLTRELEDTREELGSAQALLQIEVEDADARSQVLQELKAQAQQESMLILQKAEQDAGELREGAQAEGYLEGYAKGAEEAKSEYIAENAPKARQLEDLLCQIDDYKNKLVRESESQLVELVIAVAHKVLNREIRTEPQAVADMLRSVTEDNRRQDFIKITLAADLIPVETKAGREIKELLMRLGANVTIVTDESLEAGACLVETPTGITDVSINTQLDNINCALREA